MSWCDAAGGTAPGVVANSTSGGGGRVSSSWAPEPPLAVRAGDGEEVAWLLALYVIEELTDQGTGVPAVWTVMPRYDEQGAGSPLVFTSAVGAAEVVRASEDASGCYGGARLAELRVVARTGPFLHCDACNGRDHEEGSPACPGTCRQG